MTMSDFFTRFKNSGQFTVRAQNSPGEALLWFSAEGQPPYNHEVLAMAARHGKWAVGLDAVDTATFDALVWRPRQPDPVETRPRPDPSQANPA